MNTTVRDLLLIIVIVVLCLSLYMNKVEMEKVNERLEILECNVRVFTRRLECAVETCDGRFAHGLKYWDNNGE